MEFRIMEKKYFGTKPSECTAEVKLTDEEKNEMFGENRDYFVNKTQKSLVLAPSADTEIIQKWRIFINKEWVPVVKVISLFTGDLNCLIQTELGKNTDFHSQKNYIQQLNKIIEDRSKEFEMIEHKITFPI